MIELLRHPRTFPSVLIVLDIVAAANCGAVGQWWKVIYWTAAAVLTVSVTYGME